MSKRSDRERAESGLIFRDGHLICKKDWLATHPTAEEKRMTQAQVDEAIEQMRNLGDRGIVIVKAGQVLDPKDTATVIEEAKPYYCTKCKVTHRKGKIHSDHHQYASQIQVA